MYINVLIMMRYALSGSKMLNDPFIYKEENSMRSRKKCTLGNRIRSHTPANQPVVIYISA